MTTIEKLKEGCGEDFSHPCSAFRMCRKGDLCPICQAKLSQYTEDVEEFKKKIDDMPCLDKRHISHPCQEHPKIINADELKSSLEKDTEIKLRRGVCEGCTDESCKGCYYYNEE